MISTGSWYHVAITYDGTGTAGVGEKIKFYINGQQVPGSAISNEGGDPGPSSFSTKIGVHAVSAGLNVFNGLIDEVELFSRPLDPGEIAAIYNAGPLGKCECTPPPSGMISWWPGPTMDDIQDGNDLSDGSGNGFGTQPGEVGQAFTFDGTQFLTAGSPANLALTGATVSIDGWIYPTDAADFSSFVLLFGHAGSGQHDYSIILNGDITGVIKTDVGNPGLEDYVHTGITPPLNQWTHVALTWDGTTITVYVNGVAAATHGKGGNLIADAPFNIGGRSDCCWYKGAIDEVEVFGTALTAADVAAIYRAGSAGKCKSCATYSASFTENQEASPDAIQGWTDFRAGLTPSAYDTITISGSLDPVGRTLTDAAVVPQIAEGLKNSNTNAWTVGNITWTVGVGCGPSGTDVELNARLTSSPTSGWCQCEGPETYTVRPEIDNGNPGNYNWGGVNSNTCNGPSQTMTVVFSNSGSGGKCKPAGPAERQLVNISSRVDVGTGDNVGIGGFIIHTDPSGTGTRGGAVVAKQVLIRGLGPSLQVGGTPLVGRLMDPVLDLYDSNGTLIDHNDNWMEQPDGTSNPGRTASIQGTGLAPSDPNEAAILGNLPTDSGYTAILSGKDESTGIGLVEVYDMQPTADTHLTNISTRGFVSTGDDVLIGGFIVEGGTSTRILLRAIGPSLQASVPNRLEDPVLELYDNNGALLERNDDWGSSLEAADIGTILPPGDPKDSAILFTPAPGGYTAIVTGNNPNPTGNALVEVYRVASP